MIFADNKDAVVLRTAASFAVDKGLPPCVFVLFGWPRRARFIAMKQILAGKASETLLIPRGVMLLCLERWRL